MSTLSYDYSYSQGNAAGHYIITPKVELNPGNYTITTIHEGTLTVLPKTVSSPTVTMRAIGYRDPGIPMTGDGAGIDRWLCLAAISLCVGTACLYIFRRKKA